MPYGLTLQLKVKDFAKWKSEFDSKEGAAVRKAGCMKSYQLFQIENDPNNLVLLTEFDNLDAARKFMQSKELKEAMEQSGVIGEGDTYFIKEVEKASV